MEQRLSIVTLGVADIARARGFYEALGWAASRSSNDQIVFFQLAGMALALYGGDDLAADARVAPGAAGAARITLAHNAHDRAEVDALLAAAERAGATILKPAEDASWGGYSGYFADPDGHAWEIAWNPHTPLKADGSFVLAD